VERVSDGKRYPVCGMFAEEKPEAIRHIFGEKEYSSALLNA